MTRGSASAIWLPTMAVIAAWSLAIAGVHVLVVRPRVAHEALGIALSLAGVQTATVILLLLVLFVRKWRNIRRARMTAALREEIAAALALDIAGQDRLRTLRGLAARSRRDVELELEAMAATLRGSARDRILKLSGELGFTHDTEEERLEELFARAGAGNLLDRAVAAEELEPAAGRLAAAQIPKALRSDDVSRVILALEMVQAWKRALSIPEVEPLLRHGNPAVRAGAVRALPYAGATDAAADIRRALADDHPAVRVAAAETARKMRLDVLLETLAGNVNDPDRHAALAAAFALGVLPGGMDRLQRLIDSSERAAVSVAFEALEKAMMGRLELA